MFSSLRKPATLVLTTLGVALLAGSADATNLVTNGNFESYTGTAPQSNPSLPKTYFTSASPTDWSGGSGLTFLDAPGTADGSGYLPVYGPFPSTSENGGDFVEADGNPNYAGAFSQTINGLVVGKSYTLSFDQAAGQQTGYTGLTTEQWQVTFGSSTQYSALMTTQSQSLTPWQTTSLTFVATSTSQVLSFLAWGDGGSTVNLPPIVFLDGVDLELTPEPISLSLFASGLLGLGLVARRRARRTESAE